MKTKLAMTWLVSATLLGPIAAVAVADQDTDRSHPKEFVKDSAITTKIKTKLAAEHVTSLGRIHVDTDRDGVVWLSGHARSNEAVEEGRRDRARDPGRAGGREPYPRPEGRLTVGDDTRRRIGAAVIVARTDRIERTASPQTEAGARLGLP